jgi:phosphoribosylformimino-5-aminoimidazole carboxamide ribonucleotide (ProFAR) isomerase
VSRCLVTAIERDGTLAGPDLELVALAASIGPAVLAAGGIRSPDDVAALAAAGAAAAIVGRALFASATP